MPPLHQITFCFYTSTKGHFNRKTDWRLTLNHWDKQAPLSSFGLLVAHIKVTPGEEGLAAAMESEMRDRGFHVIQTLGGWTRGMSHQNGYMEDCIKVSKDRDIYDCPYYLHVEDDSPIVPHVGDLTDLLKDSVELLQNHETLTVRPMRRGDDKGPTTAPSDDPRLFWSEHVNFQPLLMRSLDFYRVGLALEANPQARQQIQCEMLWRLILANFSRSPYKHAVW